jgi:hypothetical protein
MKWVGSFISNISINLCLLDYITNVLSKLMGDG